MILSSSDSPATCTFTKSLCNEHRATKFLCLKSQTKTLGLARVYFADRRTMSATHVPEIIDCGQNIPKQLINMEKHNINIFSSLPFEAQSCKQHN